ncbi:alginate O-acetyltransferase [Pandoraea cepalis]|uniref:Alginate O-acetyltransferase n=1 Tax=Pandoraea cepalis TaxID=2508294 RepID=A0A5E4WB14_9BURK|nr:alginate O-acetyltransferase [Pandoraea cepalis]VVE21778.1 alginate O-acetyltransferase [Pandoraea cepalis]
MLENVEIQPRAQRPLTWLKKLNRVAVPLAFFSLIALPIAWFGRASFAPSPLHENRVLEPFPDLSIRSLQSLERWFSDRFGMRDALVYYGSRLQIARTGSPTNQDVVVGPNKWLFFDQYYVPGQPHFADVRGKDPLSRGQLRAIVENLGVTQNALSACGIPFYFIVAPDKQYVYPEQLGIHVNPNGTTQLDQLLDYFKVELPGLRVVDLRPALNDAKRNTPYEMYTRTDTHWNSLGAFYAYQALAKRFIRDGIIISAPAASLNAWTVTQSSFDQGDIAVSLLSLPGYFEDFNTHFEKRSPRLAQWVDAPADAPQSGDSAFSTNANGHGRLLLYKDSFSGELLPFVAEDFAATWSYLGRDMDGNEIRRRKPTVVALQIVQRNIKMLRNSPPKNMTGLCED